MAVVDGEEKTLFYKMVKPEKPVVSYLTPLTGVREGDLDNGEALSDVIAQVKAILGPDVILVDQSIQIDMELQQGEDCSTYIDLDEMFKANTLIQPGTYCNH